MRAKGQFGFSLLEVIVGISIVAVFLYASLLASKQFLLLSRATVRDVQAGFLLEEGVEALRVVRDQGWTTNIDPLSEGSTYALYFNPDVDLWEVSSTSSELIDNLFTRTFVVEDVDRDSNDDIVESGTLDPDTLRFTVTVAWNGPTGDSRSRSLTTYLTNFFND